MTGKIEIPAVAEPHPNFSDALNHNIIQSEIEGGVYLRDLLPGTELEVKTQNHVYRVVSELDGEAWISGHPLYCPDPVLVDIHGSTWGGSMIKERFIGRGMHLEFGHPDYWRITTSCIVNVQEKDPASPLLG